MNKKLSEKLIDWYQKNKRVLPWRLTKDFYSIWLSEIMLQQTQVKTVIPYYNKWIKRYPKFKNVAITSEDEVLKYWEGLGYYSRVRNFKKSCEIIFKNRINLNTIKYNDFLKLPGVGVYTASAVFSIVKNEVYPVLDGNVKRVISRFLRLKKPPNNCIVQINNYLNEIISLKNPGDFNQGIMELGATVCTPKKPNCKICPINTFCSGYQLNDYLKYPIIIKKSKKPHYNTTAGVIWHKDYVIISKRKSKGLLGGLWEFPGGRIEKKETAEECLKREIRKVININVKIDRYLGKIKHEYSHFSITLNAYECSYISGKMKSLNCADVKKIKFNEVKKFAFPKANHKMFKLIKNKI